MGRFQIGDLEDTIRWSIFMSIGRAPFTMRWLILQGKADLDWTIGGFYKGEQTLSIWWIQEFRMQATHDGLGGAMKVLRKYNSL